MLGDDAFRRLGLPMRQTLRMSGTSEGVDVEIVPPGTSYSAFCNQWLIIALCASPLADSLTERQRGGV